MKCVRLPRQEKRYGGFGRKDESCKAGGDMTLEKGLAPARSRAYNSKEKFQKKERIRTWRS